MLQQEVMPERHDVKAGKQKNCSSTSDRNKNYVFPLTFQVSSSINLASYSLIPGGFSFSPPLLRNKTT
jgi:hypothetical protein